jgi:hypothetical protein
MAFSATQLTPVPLGEQESSPMSPTGKNSPPQLRSKEDTRIEAGKAPEIYRGPPSHEEISGTFRFNPETGQAESVPPQNPAQ